MNTLIKLLRWVLFIPAGCIAAVLVSFPIHWIMMLNFGSGDLIDLSINPDNLSRVEWFLQGIFGPLAFTYASAKTAPSYNRTISILVGVAIIVLNPLAMLWFNTLDTGYVFDFSVSKTLAHIVGVTGGVCLIWFHEWDT